MRQDLDDVAALLEACEASPVPYFLPDEVRMHLGWTQERLAFNLLLLVDQRLVARFGEGTFKVEPAYPLKPDGSYRIKVDNHPLRLTAAGHGFLGNLRQQGVSEKVKEVAADAGLSLWMSVAGRVAAQAVMDAVGLGPAAL